MKESVIMHKDAFVVLFAFDMTRLLPALLTDKHCIKCIFMFTESLCELANAVLMELLHILMPRLDYESCKSFIPLLCAYLQAIRCREKTV